MKSKTPTLTNNDTPTRSLLGAFRVLGGGGLASAALLTLFTVAGAASVSAQSISVGKAGDGKEIVPVLVSENCVPSNGAPDPGEEVTYTFTFANTSDVAANNVAATLLPGGNVNRPTGSSTQLISVPAKGSVTANFSFISGGQAGGNVTPIFGFTGGFGNITFPGIKIGTEVVTTTSQTFATVLTFPAVGKASTYPAEVTFAGLSANVTGVTVNITGLSHTFPDDINLLLVGPKGQKVVLMANVGGGSGLANQNFTFDDGAENSLSDSGALAGGTFKPTLVVGDGVGYPEVGPGVSAPAEPYATKLDVFKGQDPNGKWQLWAFDDNLGDAGTLNSFTVNIKTSVQAVCDTGALPSIVDASNNPLDLGNTSTPEDTTKDVVFNVKDTATTDLSLITVTATSTEQGVVADSGITVVKSGAQRTLKITPVLNATGKTKIKVIITDTDGFSNAAADEFELEVTAVNDLPSITTISNISLAKNATSAALGFTLSDLETAAGSLLLFVESDTPGVVPNDLVNNLILGGSGSSRTVTVKPATDAIGIATITVRVVDEGGGTASTKFTVAVSSSAAGAPVVSPTPDSTRAESAEDTSINVVITFADDGPLTDLSFSVVSSNPGLIAGPEKIEGTGSSRNFNLKQIAHQSGVATITVFVTDKASPPNTTADDFKITVTSVPDAPVLGAIGDKVTKEDQAVTASFTVTDFEGAFGSIRFFVTTDNATLIPLSNVNINLSGSSAILTAVPVANRSGTAKLTIVARNAANLDSAAVMTTITVTPVNDAPSYTAVTSSSVNEDSGLKTITDWATSVSGGAEEASQIVTFTVTSNDNPDLIPTGGITFSEVTGGKANLNYTPAANRYGTAKVGIAAIDNGGTTDGGINTSSSVVLTITVSPVNDKPTFTMSSPTIALTEIATANDQKIDNFITAHSAGGVAGNEDTQKLTYVFTVPTASAGLFQTLPAIDPATKRLTFKLAPYASGVVAIDVVLKDDGGTASSGADTSDKQVLTLNITPVADNPTLVGLPAKVTTGKNVNSSVVAFSVTDPDFTTTSDLATKLTVTFSPDPSSALLVAGYQLGVSGGSRALIIQPKTDQLGMETVTVTVTDDTGRTDSKMFIFEVVNINVPPTITKVDPVTTSEDSPSLVVGPFTISDVEDAISLSTLAVVASSSNQSLVKDAEILVTTPAGNQRSLIIKLQPDANGSTVIKVKVTDLGIDLNTDGDKTDAGETQSAETSFVLTVSPVDDKPTISFIEKTSTDEDTLTKLIPFTVQDGVGETAADAIIVEFDSSNKALVPLSNITNLSLVGGTGKDRTLQIQPAANLSGRSTITVKAKDASAQTTETTFVLTVVPVNDPPVATKAGTTTPLGDLSIDEDAKTNLDFNISDVETEAKNVTYTVTKDDEKGILASVALTGETGFADALRRVVITPAAHKSGTAKVTITLTDTATAEVKEDSVVLFPSLPAVKTVITFSVTVNSVNDVPTITPIANTTVAEDVTAGPLLFVASDADDTLTVANISVASTNPVLLPVSGIAVSGGGTSYALTLKPAANQSGTSDVMVTVKDAAGASASRTFTLTVTEANDPPTLTVTGSVADKTPEVTTPEGTETSVVNLDVSDPDSALNTITLGDLTISASPTDLLTPAGVIFGGTGSRRGVIISPTVNRTGTATITFRATDDKGAKSGAAALKVIVTVKTGTPPTIAPIGPQSVAGGTAFLEVTATIGDDRTHPSFLELSGNSSDQAIVPDLGIFTSSGGASRSVRISPAAGKFGTTTITLTVKDGDGLTTRLAFLFTVRKPASLVKEDFNGDGKSDLMFMHNEGFVAAWFMDGAVQIGSSFLDPNSLGTSRWNMAGNGDFNGDGKPDILFQLDDGTLAVWYMDGVVRIGSALLNPSSPGNDPNWRAKTVADLSGDGQPDVVFQYIGANPNARDLVAVWTMNGVNQTATMLLSPATTDGFDVVGSGDVNGDGKADLILQSRGNDSLLGVWFMNGATRIGATLFNPASANDPNWRIVAVGDYNGDGNVDLVFQYNDGLIGMWIMNGVAQVSSTLTTPASSGSDWKIQGPK